MANNERKDHFSIRKFSVGAASVLVGASIFGLSAQTVQAEENKTIMGSDVLESENKVKVMLDFFDNPTPAINQVNEQIAEIKSEKEVVRNPNDYSQDSFQKYTEAVKVAEVSIPAAEKAVEKAEEIQGKAEGFRKEMAETLPPEVRKDINYNIVTQEQKRAMYDRFNEMYTEVNYRTTYIDATAALSKSNKSLKDAVKGLVQSTAKDLAGDGTFDDKVPEASKIKVKSFASLTSDDQNKISALIEEHFNLSAFTPSFSYDQSNAIITYDDKSITRLPLTEVAIAESNDTPAPTPKPEVKKALLEAAITKAVEALKPVDTSNKTEDSVAAYQKALTALTTETAKAEAVKVDTSADQPKVDQAVTDLTAAIKTVETAKTALVDKTAPTPSVDKAKLEEALTKAVEALKPADTTNKTEDSVSAYQKALANLTSEKAKAETVKNDAKADQPKVNQAEKDLTAAITVVEAAKSALVEKQAEKPKPKVVEKEETKVEVVPYKTVRRDNADLEKGKENVVQEGKAGRITTVVKIVIVDGVEKERKVVSTDKVDAVDKIIEVGTKEPAAPVEPSKPEPKVVEKEETKVEVVPYKTIRRDNADLEKGKEKVVQEGKAGSITTVVKIVIVDGVEKERKVVSTDKVDAVDKIIEVGTKEPAAPVEPSKPEPKVVEKDETKVEILPYKTIRRDNANLAKGTEKVVQEGKEGIITTIEHVVLVDGVEKERKVIVSNKVDAVDKIIEVGTQESSKPGETPVEPSKPETKIVEKNETKVEIVSYKTIRRDNANLAKGVEKVIQEGKDGIVTTVEHVVLVDGKEVERKVVSTNKVDAVDKIIEVGTQESSKPGETPVEPAKPEVKIVEKDETKVEVLSYKTIRRDNANLAKGVEKVIQEGKDGSMTTVEHVVLADGKEVERKLVSMTKVDAVDKIIEVGTKVTSTPGDTPVEPAKPEAKIVEKEETKVEVLSYKTIRRDNANLAKGVEKVIQEGKDGSVTTVERVVLVDGKETERKVVSTSKVDAVDKIIEVGTKVTSTPGVTPVEPAKPEAKVTEKFETKKDTVAFKTIRRDNANLAKGVEKVVQEGKDGSVTTVERVVYVDGKETDRKVVSTTKVDAVDKIIEVGTKEVAKPADPAKPVEPAKPVDPTKPADSAKPAVKPEQPVNTPVKPSQSTARPSAVAEKPAEPAKKPVATKDSSGKEQLPNTGTEASGLSALGISLMAAASALFVGKRKKNDKE